MPGIVIAALRGGSGKTILSIGIIAAWRLAGLSVAPFKKGPDYIDAGWLSLAASQPCYNLDTFLTPPAFVTDSFLIHSVSADIAVVEGNRGLYDGIDLDAHTSTAEIAKLIDLPVLLCVDCTKTTRTMAAIILGCLRFDPELKIRGVLLNRVAGARHENILRQNIEHYCGIPVVGAVPKLTAQDFPERHMGLVPTPEHDWAKDSINAAAAMAQRYINLDSIASIAKENSGCPTSIPMKANVPSPIPERLEDRPVIGVLRDSAFQFYYPDNLEALRSAGAELVFTSPLKEDTLPDVDALYIGGGFPETHAERLADNTTYRNELKRLADGHLPIYAECGGLMYLGEKIILGEKFYAMTGVLPIVFGLSKKPQGHGYTVSVVDSPNPFFPIGMMIRGHEFRYSTILEWRGSNADMVFATQRGIGFQNRRDGICYKNVLASYTHLHFAGTPGWANALVKKALEYKKAKKTGQR